MTRAHTSVAVTACATTALERHVPGDEGPCG
jgi:hypothetical protein